ncbi:MAG: NACHT domain-containing protein [Oscillatoriales cyanobacterium RM2_1_1]|nr:NACHT domain-containing protein [Oscillatoriales cyanobacterium SM2_3_0]NJO45273.1 NACHT domain-containing protein [Oscillatoriales cyanobacterium RM2_1_1]
MPKPISDPVHRQHRSQLLSQVQAEIQQYRNQSLHRAVLTQLVQEAPPLKMRRNWDIEAKVGNRPSFRLKAGSGVIPIFDRIGGKLLILGATGSGKTTTLMGLTKALVKRAIVDREEPIPVLLKLNTWSPSQAIADWIVNQLQAKYKIPPDMSWYWLDNLQILPLLDGFDEVEPAKQDDCLQAINELLVGHLCPLHLVVCIETATYKHCQNRLHLNGAILMKPLSKKQIRDYLIKAKSRELWLNIEDNASLMKLAKKPLFLSLMALTLEELLVESWKRLESLEEQCQYLFNAYIRRQISRDYLSKNPTQTPEQLRQWFSWLAQQLESENRTEFSPQEIPRDWLQTPEQKKAYSLRMRVISGIIWGGILLWICIGAIRGSIIGVISGANMGLIWVLVTRSFSWNERMEQFILQSVLSSKGYLPWQYRRFLNHGTQKLILQKVGNQYRFIHRLLQRHFSQM